MVWSEITVRAETAQKADVIFFVTSRLLIIYMHGLRRAKG